MLKLHANHYKMSRRIVILGAGLAGLTVAETLRADAYDGPISLIGDEAYVPYQRPPLSKRIKEARVTLNASQPSLRNNKR